MKIGFISDLHGNLPAFKKVLEHMNNQSVDIKVCLGDLVGYGPYPNECIDMAVSNFNYIIMGNHDKASIDLESAWGFNPLAREAIEWTNKNVTEDNKLILKGLEYAYTIGDKILLVHGSPSEAFGYIVSTRDAEEGFSNPITDFNIAFVGHTHVPSAFIKDGTDKVKYVKPELELSSGQISVFSFKLPQDVKAIINVGSVGQPRDNDPRASYLIFDTETREITYFKVPYDIELITGRMQRIGFSTQSWMRLMHGK